MNYQQKVILGGFMGNVVEAYDISICYFLAGELSNSLLGKSHNNPTIILALVFLAYLAKPIGAFILGILSDRFGRKPILIGSIIVMGLSTALIGIIPNFNQINILAALILLSLRIIQSMALGSEFLNSASFLVESGNLEHRGFRGCWSSVGVKAGYLLACLVTELARLYFDYPTELAWRIPFLLAIVTTALGVYIRYNMPESLDYVFYYAGRKKPSTNHIYKNSIKFIKKYPLLANYAFFASFLSVTTGFFFYLYIPLHAASYSLLDHKTIITSTIVSLIFVTVLIPIFGAISDKQDRLNMLRWASIGLLILAYPFMQIINFGNKIDFFIMQLLISIPCACYYSVSSVILTELFPLPIRCTALSIIFSVAASLASGVPPLLANYLSRVTGNPNSPSMIIIIAASIVLININALAYYYKIGKNKYINRLDGDTKEIFKIYYNK